MCQVVALEGTVAFTPESAAFSLMSVQGLCNVIENTLVFLGWKETLIQVMLLKGYI